MYPYQDKYNFSCRNCNKEDFSYFSHNYSSFGHSYHNYFASLIADRVADAIERRDFALSTALLMNEGYSFDFSLIASLQLVGGQV